MKHLLATTAVITALLSVPALAAGGPPYAEDGPVWDMVQIQTKDGHTDAYMKWLDTEWKAQQEALLQGGYIIGYKVYLTTDPRAGEPDVVLATEYKNMAAFDTPPAEMMAFMAKHFGSLQKADKGEADRASMRTVLGDVLVREAILK